jgi:glucose/arabinose dehydrogenase/PKD repeat protein
VLGNRAARPFIIVVTAALLTAGAPVARLVAPATAHAAGPVFADPHFRESPVFGGLDGPMAIRFATDGRAFVAEKSGLVKAFDSIADTTPTTVLDLRAETHDYWDRGLLNAVLDPGFLWNGANARPYLYVYYVYDAPPGGTAPTWNDNCPGSPVGPGPTADGCVVTARLARYTINPDTNAVVPGSRLDLLHDFCAQFPSHSGGGMAFGPDGELYLAGGDGASFTIRDYGQRGGTIPDTVAPFTPVNPCGDPVTITSGPGEQPVVDVATAEGGSLRSQDVRTTGDPTGLDGALVRIDPDTGLASDGNPLTASADQNTRRIVAHGFRNPYRLVAHPASGDLYIGDVGNDNWEEIERYVPGSGGTTATTLPNYGWPCYEGGGPTDGWPELGSDLCDALYGEGSGAVIDPLYAYNHAGPEAPCGTSGYTTASVTGVAFYDAAAADPGLGYPAAYDGALFLVDYSRKCLAVLFAGPGGVPDPSTMQVVGTGLGDPVDLVAGPHGDLYYADLHGSRVMRVRYAPEPVAAATVTPPVFRASPASDPVALDASASLDPDPLAELVAWRWDLDHDGSFDGPGDASGQTVSWAITVPGVYPVTLRVQSSNGLSDTLELTVDASDAPPVPVIDLPTPSETWAVGDTISFAGHATDEEDGAIPAAGLRWSIGLLHCGPSECHEHVIQTLDGQAGGQVSAPDHPYPSRLVVRLSATDSHGTVRETSLELEPQPTTITVDSVPAGVPITVGDATLPSPSETTLVRGGSMAVSAPTTWTSGPVRYRFAGWNDGSLERSRDFVVTDPVTATATFVTDAPDTCEAGQPVGLGAWTLERASGEGDEDWFSFTTSAAGRVIVSLGDLPVDARLQLHGACGTVIGTADVAGTHFEEMTRTLAAGTYRIRVTVPSGARSLAQYAVRALFAGTSLVVKSATVTRGSGTVRIAGEVFNAGTSTVGPVEVVVKLHGSTGKLLRTLRATAFATRLGAAGVTSFTINEDVPAWAYLRFSLSAGSPHAARTLTLRSLTLTPGAGGTVTETGRVRNDGRATAAPVAVARTWYGRRGEVLAVRWTSLTPSTLAPGGGGRFTIVRPALFNVQASRTQLRGS